MAEDDFHTKRAKHNKKYWYHREREPKDYRHAAWFMFDCHAFFPIRTNDVDEFMEQVNLLLNLDASGLIGHFMIFGEYRGNDRTIHFDKSRADTLQEIKALITEEIEPAYCI